jgi:thioredoxin reductase (NADPH)
MSLMKSVIVIGTVDDYEIRDLLTPGDQPYGWLDADLVRETLGIYGASLPVVIVDGEIVLVQPTLEELGDALGVRERPRADRYDVVIIGAGPAGLAAAVYAAGDGLSVAVLERSVLGGQASYTSQIENHFGIDPLGLPMTGAHLARIRGRQAEKLGTELLASKSCSAAASTSAPAGARSSAWPASRSSSSAGGTRPARPR